MRRRYDLERSDNYMLTGRVSSVVSGSGTIFVYTGFPVTSASVSFATIPCVTSVVDLSSSSSSSSEGVTPSINCPRLYVSSYTDTGFYVSYEGIEEAVGFVEFVYNAV